MIKQKIPILNPNGWHADSMKIANIRSAAIANTRPIFTVCALIVATVFVTRLDSSRYKDLTKFVSTADG